MQAEPPVDWLRPSDWPDTVGALMTTRAGGVSTGPFASMNPRPPLLPSTDATDTPDAIEENQRRLAEQTDGAVPVYLEQVHGARVVRLDADDAAAAAAGIVRYQADASITNTPGVACTVLVADCLPVLLMAGDGLAVGAAHAGWRGLAGGVLEATVQALCDSAGCAPQALRAWLGASIGPDRFEVGADVRDAFADAAPAHFRPVAGRNGKWWAHLPGLARDRLAALGVPHVSGGHWCTVSDPARFYSYRRDRITGRHAACVWLRPR